MTTPSHLQALTALIRTKVDFLLIGALALDHFAPEAAADDLVFRRILEYKITARAERADSLPIDMRVEAKGFDFQEWWADRTHFKVGRSRVPCASLEHVLESKRQAGRDKDKKLLALYEAAYKPLLKRRRKSR